jgi:glutamate racemase
VTTTRRRPTRRREEERERAIGIFDSGIGGLTVLRALTKLLPNESLVYLGDTGRTPYGTKSADVVRRYSFENTAFLIDKQVKLLVVACNTSTALALDALRQRVEVPVVGVIEPGARAAVRATRSRKIGVIGTEATIRSGEYTRALRRLRADLEIYTRACPLFVPLAEEGWVDNEVAARTARLYLTSLARSGIDTLILGCTHYPRHGAARAIDRFGRRDGHGRARGPGRCGAAAAARHRRDLVLRHGCAGAVRQGRGPFPRGAGGFGRPARAVSRTDP